MKKLFALLIFSVLFYYSNAQTSGYYPDTIASNITVSSRTSTSAYISFTPGSGNRRIIVVRLTSNAVAKPTNLVAIASNYTANATFMGSGSSNLGNSNYVVYNSNGTGVTVNGLTAGTQYTVTVFEYFKTSTYCYYRTDTYPASNFYTISAEPTSQPDSVYVTNIAATTAKVNVDQGNGTNALLVVAAGKPRTALAMDGDNDRIKVSYNSQLQPTSSMSLELWAYQTTWNSLTTDQVLAGNYYNGGYSIFLDANSQTVKAKIKLDNNTTYTCSYSSTALSSGWHHFMLTFSYSIIYSSVSLYIDGTQVDQELSTADEVSYSVANAFWIGAEAGSGSTSSGKNFLGKIDEVRLWNSAKSGGSNMNTKIAGSSNGLIAAWSLEEGNSNTDVAANSATSGSVLNGLLTGFDATNEATGIDASSGWIYSDAPLERPIDGTYYAGNSIFSSGDNLGNTNYVVHKASTFLNFTAISNLSSNTDYTLYGYEYNQGGSTSENYKLPRMAIKPFHTLYSEPTQQASYIWVTDKSHDAFRVNWVNGNGSRRIVVIKKGSTASTSYPVDGVSYNTDTAYGQGELLAADEYFVYKGTANYVDVTGLDTATAYTIRVFEYNGTGSLLNYYTYLSSGNNYVSTGTLPPHPTNIATNLSISNITESAADLSFNTSTSAGSNYTLSFVPLNAKSAIKLDGTNDYLEYSNEAAFDFTNALYFDAWIKFETPINSNEVIISKSGAFSIKRYLTTGRLIVSAYTQSGLEQFVSVRDIPNNEWHHIAVSFDYTKMTLYIDGAYDSEFSNDVSNTYQTNNNPVYIGTENPAGTIFLNAIVDQVRTLTAIPSISEIRSNLFTRTVQSSFLYTNFHLDEGANGTTIAYNTGTYGSSLVLTMKNFADTTAATNFTRNSGWVYSGCPVANPLDGTSLVTVSETNLPKGNKIEENVLMTHSDAPNAIEIKGLSPNTFYFVSVHGYNKDNVSGYQSYNFKTINYEVASFTTLRDTAPDINMISINGTTPVYSASPGIELQLIGNYFSNTPELNTVYFGGVRAQVLSASKTNLKVLVPQGATHAFVTVTKNSLTGVSPYKFIPSQNCTGTLTNTVYSSSNTNLTGLSFGTEVGVVDIDADGKAEIAATGLYNDAVYFYKNNSTSSNVSFSSAVTKACGSGPLTVAFGDIDGDRYQDVITANNYGNTIGILRNKGENVLSFDAMKPLISPSYINSARLADIDGDGKLDIIAGTSYQYFSTYRNTSVAGLISFENKRDTLLIISGGGTGNAYTYKFDIGDLDADGDLDIVVLNNGTSTAYLLENISYPGRIAFTTTTLSIGFTAYALSVSDLEGDNKPDIIALTSAGLKYYKNTSSGGSISFTLQGTGVTTVSSAQTLYVADMSGDGKNDVVVGSVSNTNIAFFQNTSTVGTISFGTEIANTLPSGYSASLVLADLNLDNQPDLIATNGSADINVRKSQLNALASEPTISSYNITSSNRTTNSITIDFSNGNGTNRIIVCRPSVFTAASPMDGVNYTANTSFGNGSAIGYQNYIVYNSNSNSVTVTGLESATAYSFMVYEYHGSGCTNNYLLTDAPNAQFYTLNYAPTIDSISIQPSLCQAPGEQIINLSGIGTGGENQNITLSATSSNPALVSNPTITYVQGQSTATLSYTPNVSAYGAAKITIVVDDGGIENAESFRYFDVNISQKQGTPDAGSPMLVCASQINLNGNTIVAGTSDWDILFTTNNAVLLSNESSPSAILSGLNINDSVVVQWSFSNGACPVLYDTSYVVRTLCPLKADFVADITSTCLADGDSVLVQFTDASSSSGTNIIAYTWSFGADANPIEYVGQTPPLVKFYSSGTKTISLSITDDLALSDDEIKVGFLTVNEYPLVPNGLTLPSFVCQGSDNNLLIAGSSLNADSYDWNLNQGLIITNGVGSNSIYVSVSDTNTIASIQVRGQNTCGYSNYTTLEYVPVNKLPSVAGIIAGNEEVCEGAALNLTVGNIPDAATYEWLLPSGYTPSGSTNLNTLTLNIDENALANYIQVRGYNDCGYGEYSQKKNILVLYKPEAAGIIIGSTEITECPRTIGAPYQISPISNADYYIWSLPSDVFVDGGDSTTVVSLTFDSLAFSGEISVQGANVCGIGTASFLDIEINRLPGEAGYVFGMDSVTICPLDAGLSFSLLPVFNADYYVWQLPMGANVFSGDSSDIVNVYISAAAHGGFISVTPMNACGAGNPSQKFIKVKRIDMQEICLVTSDSLNDNTVVWQKNVIQGAIAGYNIYREDGIVDQFNYTGFVSYDSLSEYLDTIVNAAARAYRYKVTALDSCGNETDLSAHHKTVHMTVSEDLNTSLPEIQITDHYEGFGFQSYKVWRSLHDTLSLVATLPFGIINSVKDFNLPSWFTTLDTLTYFVTTEGSVQCIAERAKNYNASRSNTASLKMTATKTKSLVQGKSMFYPNPSNNGINVWIEANGLVEIYAISGQQVYNKEMQTGSNFLNTANLSEGTYIIKIISNNTVAIDKLVIKH